MLTIDRRRFYYHLIFISFCLLFLIKYDSLKPFSNENVLKKNLLLDNPTVFDCSGDPLKQWCEHQTHICDSSLIIFNQLFAKTHSVVLQAKLANGKRHGGENLSDVLNQDERDEYFHFEKEFIKVIYLLILNMTKNTFMFSFHVILP